ncbi:P-loop containing nucleoside triphosphate hydrolase protein [Aspergillus pseudonomiae]|uniref:ATP-dependent RNA helicase n=1 Tax=Aspergillus pseudonomiae TaxID=1506151 RepID=A0A5N6HQY9_9EURO|nr:P-loop containing nucleoside triphosphate hydrolase protein [Aspergillus pseudonomiae]KAB8256099.1 P-loop containing nucleoside triphosphate hydrolase protein [Aspergillus pseudonomiae]KAE8399613.1 P-loop containing nucleoside triphosphate hydrolase protein [Aspergillus pseudonomiae]
MAGDHSAHDVSSKKSSSTPLSAKKSQKRKRDPDGSVVPTSTPTPTKKPKKIQSPSSTPTPLKESRKKKRKSESAASGAFQEESSQEESAVSPVSRKKASTSKNDSKDKTKKKSKKLKRESRDNHGSSEDAADIEEPNSDQERTVKKHVDSKDIDAMSEDEDNAKPQKNKYSGILSKFEKAVKATESARAKSGEEDVDNESTGPVTAEPVIAQGLEPLPQPEAAPEQDEKPSYSSLPSWLANPLRTSAEEKTPFSSLGIEENVLRILENNGYKEAFAVQSTVIPLLLQGSKNHPGDVCISAATGSGKTLSYVLPMVTALEQVPAPRLRGLIVVPTRELVKQAREACELCAAGSGLRVASAVGNVAIKEEQRSLMRVDEVYGPENFKLRQQDKLTDNDWLKFSLQDYISDAGDQSESLPGYIRKAEPNVDILICTPGRLVDHIRYTKGFTLKHLEWLVIDEADRLLNESFQEWVDVVMNSLDARRNAETFGFSGKFLANLGLPIQTKDPRKVILSATMTKDISKLNSLRLSNPKLVIVGSAEQATSQEDETGIHDRAGDQYTLPPRLKECSLSVGDGSQKPLYLLRLLLSHIKVDVNKNTKRALINTSDTDDTSSEGSSSEESSSDESDSDSASDSESSDSDTDTDTSSSDESSSEESGSDSSSDDSSSSSDSSDSEDDSASEGELSVDVKADNSRPRASVLIFTKSSESASRLARLLALLDPSLAKEIGTIIKSNKSSASRKTLTAYRQGKISIIIATDRASRGLDLQSLTHVVNYDVPTSITTYVHRVGRTARAGREGSAWTLVAHREGRWFTKEIIQTSDNRITRSSKVQKVTMKLDNMKDVKSRYRQALDTLEKEVKTGGTGKASRTEK